MGSGKSKVEAAPRPAPPVVPAATSPTPSFYADGPSEEDAPKKGPILSRFAVSSNGVGAGGPSAGRTDPTNNPPSTIKPPKLSADEAAAQDDAIVKAQFVKQTTAMLEAASKETQWDKDTASDTYDRNLVIQNCVKNGAGARTGDEKTIIDEAKRIFKNFDDGICKKTELRAHSPLFTLQELKPAGKFARVFENRQI